MIKKANPLVDNVEIKRKARERGYTNSALADALDVSKETISNRWVWANWTVAEAWKLHLLLDLPLDVFFAHPEKLSVKGSI